MPHSSSAPDPLPALNRRGFHQLCAVHALMAVSAPAQLFGSGNGQRIERIEAFAVRYAMTGHFKFFTGPHGGKGRASVLVKITTGDGLVGWGQSVPIAKWSYETLETVTLVLSKYFAPALIGLDPFELEAAHARMSKTVADGFSTGMPIARAGIDLALHDLAGKRAGKSVAELWARKADRPLRLSWTLNPRDLSEVDSLVNAGKARGYQDFNIKVSPDPIYDAQLVARVRELAPDAFLWTDANGGYSPEVALQAAPMLAEAGVSILEAPMKPNQIEGYQKLTAQGALPILMDEGVISPIELREFIRLKMLNGVAMKPSRCGGLLSARLQIEMLEKRGLMWVGSGLTDPDISLAATLQLYGAYGLKTAAALNGPQFITQSLLKNPFEVVDGALMPSAGPGLGVEIDEEKLAELVATTAAENAKKNRAGAAALAMQAPSEELPFTLRWEKKPGQSLALLADGKDLWRFRYESNQAYSYFHPLALPGTAPITRDAPADHIHHHGMWFSWKYINGVNFWENAPGGDRPAGRTHWLPPKVNTFPNRSALIRMKLRYSVEAEDLLKEDREIRIHAPKPDGSYVIDWNARFTALAEQVKLDRTPLPAEPNGKAWGGYAGLSLRLANLDDRSACTDSGQVNFNPQDRYRGKHSVFEYNGSLDEADVGIAVRGFDQNLNSPSPWYSIRSKQMSFFTPAVICYGAHEMQRGDSFTLRYQIHVHPGRWNPTNLQDLLSAPPR